jgi:hypothetical protein
MISENKQMQIRKYKDLNDVEKIFGEFFSSLKN